MNTKYVFIRPEILTHPNIPKPLHGLNPRTILGDAWWNEQRQIAYAKNNYCCWACGIHKSKAKYHSWLEAHEMYQYDYAKGEAKLVEIVALCPSCHNFIHDGRMEMMVQSGEMELEKMLEILVRGGKILAFYELSSAKQRPPITEVAEWDKWHLIIDDKKYFSKFKNIDEWAKFYAQQKG